MPLWLWKALPYIGAVLLVGAAVWYIDHRGYKRAEAEAVAAESQRKLDLAAFVKAVALEVKDLEGSMQTAINESDSRVVGAMSRLDIENRTIIQPTLTKEIQREVRLSDPSLGITDVMRGELNRARSFSEQRPCPAGSNAIACFALPAAEPAQ